MQTFSRKPWTGSLAACAIVLFTSLNGFAQTGVPIPKVTGPIPASSGSVPFLAADRNLVPLDLSKAGYVEEEFIISGTANVYNWEADGTVSIKTPNAPYATRILVRRPANASRFSGNVVIELMHTARRFDWPMMWGYSRDYFIENGDAWVGITMPNAATGLKTFNPTRYSAISFANPSNAPCAPNAARSEIEDGLRWDAISQVAALLKSNAPARPLAGLRVEAVFLTMQGGELLTYVNAVHPLAVLANGKPAYDGYLSKSPTTPVRISQCSPAPGASDPRRTIRKTNVPVIAVVAQGEAVDALPFRRTDSDAADDKFRFYEIAGAGHIDSAAYVGFPSFAEQTAAVSSAQGTPEWPFNVTCDPKIPMMAVPVMSYAFNAAFANLEQWARKGTPAPRAERLQVKNPGTPEAAVNVDANGNGLGGVRNPYVDVPSATLFTNSAGPGVCREMGHEERFDVARFQTLYPAPKVYSDKVGQTADRLVKERWLTEADARRIKQAAQAPLFKATR
jgi:Alpha/beta hydrolase domain